MMDWLTSTDDVSSPILGHIPIGQIVIGAAFIVAVGLWMLRISRRTKPLENFLRDWNGEPARPGVDHRPGMMERMARVDKYMNEAPTAADIVRLQAEVERKASADDVDALRTQVTQNTGALKLIGGVLRVDPFDDDDEQQP